MISGEFQPSPAVGHRPLEDPQLEHPVQPAGNRVQVARWSFSQRVGVEREDLAGLRDDLAAAAGGAELFRLLQEKELDLHRAEMLARGHAGAGLKARVTAEKADGFERVVQHQQRIDAVGLQHRQHDLHARRP